MYISFGKSEGTYGLPSHFLLSVQVLAKTNSISTQCMPRLQFAEVQSKYQNRDPGELRGERGWLLPDTLL